MKRPFGFTLAELLIALAILGTISTFTIPKVLNAQQDGRYKAIAKEAIAAVSGAYAAYSLSNTPTGATKAKDLIPYLNYVKYRTDLVIDDYQTSTTLGCTTSDPCLILHNGAVLHLGNVSFSSTAVTNAIRFYVDPDGTITDGASGDPSASAQGKSLQMYLYFNGRVTSRGGIDNGTCTSNGCINAQPTYDPPWFSWN